MTDQQNGESFFSYHLPHFQNSSHKLSRIKFVCISSEVYLQRAVISKQISYVPKIFKTNCKLFKCVQMRTINIKEIFHFD